MKNTENIQSKFKQALESVNDSDLKEFAIKAQIQPFWRDLDWDYGDDETFATCFLLHYCDLYIIGCEQGHGPEKPWGVIEAGATTLGPDSLWHKNLEDAIRLAFISISFPPD